MSELKPCPFCGSDQDVYWSDAVSYIACGRCGALGPDGDDEAEIARLWNTRPEVERLTAELKEAKHYGNRQLLTKCGELELVSEKLRTALQKYGNHDEFCEDGDSGCTCGFKEALTGTAPAPGR